MKKIMALVLTGIFLILSAATCMAEDCDWEYEDGAEYYCYEDDYDDCYDYGDYCEYDDYGDYDEYEDYCEYDDYSDCYGYDDYDYCEYDDYYDYEDDYYEDDYDDCYDCRRRAILSENSRAILSSAPNV